MLTQIVGKCVDKCVDECVGDYATVRDDLRTSKNKVTDAYIGHL